MTEATETKVALTTMDNPFDPIDDFASWLRYDEDHGYYSNNYLARIVNTTDDMTQKEIDEEIERAIDEIIEFNPLGIYKKVKKDIPFIN